MSEKETPKEALRSQIQAALDFPLPDNNREMTTNRAIARNVLHTELGRYAETQPVYSLDQETRDRLIAHARQDAAHALLNTISLMKEVRRINQRTRNTQVGIVVFCIAIALWVWWPH